MSEKRKTWLIIIGLMCGMLLLAEFLLGLFMIAEDDISEFKSIVYQMENDPHYPYMEFDPVLFWKLKSNMYVANPLVQTNSLGFRGSEFSLQKDPDTIRIVCYGDSITFGYQLPQGESYVQMLENILKEKFPSRKIEVINAGVPGYTSRQGLVRYQYYGKELNPDIITVCYGANDVLERYYLSDSEIIKESPVYMKMCSILERIRLFRVVKKLLRFKKPAANKDVKVHRVSHLEYADNIERIVRMAKKRKRKIILIMPPVKIFLSRDHFLSIEKYREHLREIAEKYNISLLIAPELTGTALVEESEYFLDKVHTNAKGNALMAQHIFNILSEQDFIQ
ncbi:MAG: GDSL-type esterase/lipase family protein [bacterium]